MKPILSEERINYIKSCKYFDEYLQEVKHYAESELEKDAPILNYSAFKLFKETGDRATYEKPYFQKRKRFSAFSIMYLLYREEKYKKAIEDCIWDICSEYTWALPAHMEYPMEEEETVIDLFAAETGEMLAEFLYMAGQELAPHVVYRAKKEIKRRIITPYITFREDYYVWHNVRGNWSAVCACGIGACMFYAGEKDEIEKALPRLYSNIEAFLKSYNEDGCCLEGYSYWNYGFGRFVFFADMLKDYTGGKVDLMDSEKIHSIAKFQNAAFIGISQNISFADAAANCKPQKGLSSYLHNKYNDVAMPAGFLFTNELSRDFVVNIRDLAWFDAETVTDKLVKPEYTFYEQAQWFIRNTDKFSFAAKGGHNNEPHNHNDLGCFMLLSGDDRIINDYGSGRYTRQYFSDERYSYLVTSSRGHSVPIINGKYQEFGQEYHAEVLNADKDSFTLDIKNAYADRTLEKLVRSFEVKENGIELSDEINFSSSPESLSERFFTCIKPDIKNGFVQILNYTVKPLFDAEIKITTEKFYPHNTEKRSEKDTITAYLIDFVPKTLNKENKLKFEIKLQGE